MKCICSDGFGMNLSCPIHSPYQKEETPTENFEDTHLRPSGHGMLAGMPKCQRCGVTLNSLQSTRTPCASQPSSSSEEERLDDTTEKCICLLQFGYDSQCPVHKPVYEPPLGATPLTAKEETPPNVVRNATEGSPIPDYAITQCRGHWHVTVCGEILIGSYDTPGEAQEVADRNNAGDHSEPKGNEDFQYVSRSSQPSSSSEITEAIDAFRDSAKHLQQLCATPDDLAYQRVAREFDAARSRLESLYLELQESEALRLREIEAASRSLYDENQENVSLRATVREQLQEIERLRAFEGPDYQYAGNHIPRAAIECRNEEIRELYARLSSLKDSQLTEREREAAADAIEGNPNVSMPGLVAKLRG